MHARGMSAPILYESHCHTPLCKHALGEPEEYAAEAEKRKGDYWMRVAKYLDAM